MDYFLQAGSWSLWLILLIFFITVEAATVSLTTVWFAFGALTALITTALGGNFLLQITLFLSVSLLTLIFTRPFAKKWLLPKKEATNLDRIIGGQGQVTEEINNLNQSGEVFIGGKSWTARSEDGTVIPVGTIVTAEKISGVKLIVKQTENTGIEIIQN